MTDHNEVADLLDSAADIIERDGWCQGAFERLDGSVCAVGALRKTVGSEELTDHSSGLAALSRLSERIDGYYSVAAWNDVAERTKQEVLDAFRLAAKHERAAADGIDL